MFTKRNVALLVTEFLGTAVLALTVLAVFTSQVPVAYFVAIGAGMALFALTLVFGVSGAIVNPAITIGLWTIRKITAKRMLGYIVAQMAGALAAFALYEYMRGGDGTWGNQAGGFDGKVLAAEVVGTAIFAFGIAAMTFQRMVGVTRAAVAGVSLTVGIIVASLASFGLVNPAVAFATQSFELTTYVLGPVLGAVIGLNVYNLLFTAASAPVVARVKPVAVAKPATKNETKATAETKAKVVAAKPATKKKTPAKK